MYINGLSNHSNTLGWSWEWANTAKHFRMGNSDAGGDGDAEGEDADDADGEDDVENVLAEMHQS